MLDLGFEPQVNSIVNGCRPDRQTMLFSATMPKKVERLAEAALTDPVHISVGRVGAANEDIRQVVQVLPNAEAKMHWIREKIGGFVDEGDGAIEIDRNRI